MNRLGVFFVGSIDEPTGAGAVVRSFKGGNDIFAQNDIILDGVYSFDRVKQGQDPIGVKNKSCFFKNAIQRFGKWILEKTPKGCGVIVDKLYFSKGERIVSVFHEEASKCDILIFHDIFTFNAYINGSHWNGKQKLILILHTNGEVFRMLRIYYPKIVGSLYDKKLQHIEDRCLGVASRIVFVSQLSAALFKTHYPCYADKVSVVYNGIESVHYKDPLFDGKLRIVTTGTVNARKNQVLLIKALGKIAGKMDVVLTVIGSGDKLIDCKKMARELKVDRLIDFMGTRKDVSDILSRQNLFVMTSLDEGLPISAIEALRAKLPVILTDVGGNKELIRDNGYLIKPCLDDLVECLCDFNLDVERQKEMSLKSYQLFEERFTVERMIENYSQIIRK